MEHNTGHSNHPVILLLWAFLNAFGGAIAWVQSLGINIDFWLKLMQFISLTAGAVLSIILIIDKLKKMRGNGNGQPN